MTTLFTKSKTALYIILVGSFVGCRDENIVEDNSPLTLLPSNEWTLAAHGIDFNGNNILEPGEDLIEDCQKDNTYFFFPNGTGLFSDNDLMCGNENSADFDWQLLDKTELEIAFQPFEILTLNKRELILSPKLEGVSTKVILRYTR